MPFLLAMCQRSGETWRVTTLSCVKDFEAACNKSCKLSMRVHETRGFGAEVATQGENGFFWLHRCCFLEGIDGITGAKIHRKQMIRQIL